MAYLLNLFVDEARKSEVTDFNPVILEGAKVSNELVNFMRILANRYYFDPVILSGSSLFTPLIQQFHPDIEWPVHDIDIFTGNPCFSEFNRSMAGKSLADNWKSFMQCTPGVRVEEVVSLNMHNGGGRKDVLIKGRWKKRPVDIICSNGRKGQDINADIRSILLASGAPIASVAAIIVKKGRKLEPQVMAHPEFEEDAKQLVYRPFPHLSDIIVWQNMDKWRKRNRVEINYAGATEENSRDKPAVFMQKYDL